jgi:tungstate transport system substrate-binding protein
MKKYIFLFLLATICLAACSNIADSTAAALAEQPVATDQTVSAEPPTPDIPQLILATTTSTQDSGLLDELIPVFEQQTGYIVQVVAVGSGQAMKMGEQGNADVLLVHSPAAENTFMENGFGSERYLVMHNDFIIVGPDSDPAGVRTASSAVDAFTKIYTEQATFLSRDDASGTNKAELALWSKAGIETGGSWYMATGQGMAATLRIASEMGLYTLSDRATFLANEASLDLSILYEGDPALLNVYHVIVVNPELWPNMNLAGAQAFAQFIIAPETQQLIGSFGVSQYGQPLFFPDADKTDADLGL